MQLLGEGRKSFHLLRPSMVFFVRIQSSARTVPMALNKNFAIEAASQSAAALNDFSTEKLYEELALRMIVVRRQPALAAQFELDIDENQIPRPPIDELVAAGKRFFFFWNRELYKFLCEGDSEASKEKDRLFSALLGDSVTAQSIIAGILVGSFGMSPVYAVVVGPLVVRLLLVPTEKTLCELWKEKALQA